MLGFIGRVIERALGVCFGTLLLLLVLALGQPYTILIGEKAKAVKEKLEQEYIKQFAEPTHKRRKK